MPVIRKCVAAQYSEAMYDAVRPGRAPGGMDATRPDAHGTSLQTVAAGMPGAVSPVQFMSDIDVANRTLGNRAFMRWVGELHSGGRDAVEPGSTAPLQMMGKKKKKQGPAQGEEAVPKLVAAEPEAPGTTPKQEPVPVVASSPPTPAGAEAPAEKKKKKKSRVQVALNTLRGEGVESFKAYIEAEIGEAALLHTLVERITRAGDLGGERGEALRVVEGRLQALDPVVVASAQAPERAVIAPARSEFSIREKELFGACFRGDVKRLKRLKHLLVHEKIDINMATEHGTPLVLAALKGHANIVRELLSVPRIDVNLAQKQGATALQAAVQEGHVKVVELLLCARGINVNLARPTGVTALHIAVQKGRVEVAKLLLDKDGINVNQGQSTGSTPLYIAVQNGHAEMVRLMLGVRGINVNQANLQGATPLLVAAHKGYEEVVKLLLATPGIDIDRQKDDGATALFMAAQKDFPGIVEQLVRRGADVNRALFGGSTPLYKAAFEGHIEVVRALLRAPGIQIDQVTGREVVPLVAAAQQGHKDIVRLLLKHGAEPNDSMGDAELTALHIACLRGHMAIVEILLHAGADMDARLEEPGEEGLTHTPHSLAELGDHREVMSVLAAWRRCREAKRRIERLPITDAPGEDPGTPAVSGKEDNGETGAATKRVSPIPPAPFPPGEAAPEPQPLTPLAQAKDALRQEVLGKHQDDNFDVWEGIRLLQDVNAAESIDALCVLYNRLAHIERREERARRRGRRRKELLLTVEPAAAEAAATPVFSLGEKTGLDTEAVEEEIKRHLDQKYHRFVSQAVNNMEFGRGKPTAGYPGLWHTSAGVPGVGSCSVFYYLDGEQGRIRVVGTGHHVGRAAYRLDYATGELGEAGRLLRVA